jgi:spore maturation protein CgeB
MRILLMWSYYDAYLSSFYARYPRAAAMPYRQQLDCLLADFFNWPPRLIPYFRQAGHEADLIVANARSLQRAWARENGFPFDERDWEAQVAKEQVKRFRPDILWGSLTPLYCSILGEIRPFCGKLFAWRASSGWEPLDIAAIDCVLTSKRRRIQEFASLGKWCALVFPCFEPEVLTYLPALVPYIDVSFVGSFAPQHHKTRLHVLTQLAKRTPIQIWGSGWSVRLQRRPWPWKSFVRQVRTSFEQLPLQLRVRGEAWGRSMFSILRQSRMTINIHGDQEAFSTADNIRLFEATGVGTMLLTDAAANLPELFDPGKEVVAYADVEDLVRKTRYYLAHDDERAAIAAAGQLRVTRQHTAELRARQVLDLFAHALGT